MSSTTSHAPVATTFEVAMRGRKETILGTIREALSAYNPENKEGFKDVVRLAVDHGGIKQGDLAKEFEISAGTISRWMAGETVPMRLARKQVIETLTEMLR